MYFPIGNVILVQRIITIRCTRQDKLFRGKTDDGYTYDRGQSGIGNADK